MWEAIAKQLDNITDEKVERLGSIVQCTVAALTSRDPVLAVIDHFAGYRDLKNTNEHSSSSSDSESDEEVDGNSTEQHHEEFVNIHPFLDMAIAAYEDKSMADEFPFVRRSQLIRDVQDPSVLRWDIKTDTEVHVCVLEDESLAFAFRGTEFQREDLNSLVRDIATDVTKRQVPVELYDASDEIAFRANPTIKAHKGFQLAFRDVTKTSRPNENIRMVAEGLGAHAKNVRRVICMGHSLGGALATLCAQWCRYVAYKEAEIWCVTVGSPRVGNKEFAWDFDRNVVTEGRSYRVVNKDDIVPYLPWIGTYRDPFSTRYKHVGGLMYLMRTEENIDAASSSASSSNSVSITLKRRRRRLHISFNVRNLTIHQCVSYKESVRMLISALPHLHGRRLYYRIPPLHNYIRPVEHN